MCTIEFIKLVQSHIRQPFTNERHHLSSQFSINGWVIQHTISNLLYNFSTHLARDLTSRGLHTSGYSAFCSSSRHHVANSRPNIWPDNAHGIASTGHRAAASVCNHVRHLYSLRNLLETKRLGVLGADPHGILLVNAGRAGQGPLGQGADGDQTAHNRQGLLTLADALAERLVAVGLRLDWVVPVLGEHTALELTDNLGALTRGTNVLGGNGRHAAYRRLADVRVPGAVTTGHADDTASDATNVAGTQGRLHLPFIKKNWWRDPS